MHKKNLVLLLVLYVASALVSYGAVSMLGSKGSQTAMTNPDETAQTEGESSALSALLTINPSEPKDQACPLNGQFYTATEKAAWEKKRPLAVMIENTPDARPQSGLSNADLVFEAVAEGGVTRFLSFFYCGVQHFDTTLAPIRSARTYYINVASGFNRPLYVHVGGSNLEGPVNALGQLREYGWTQQNDMDQFSIGYPTFVRDYNRIPGKEIATEHTMVTTTEKLWAVAAKRGWTNVSPSVKSKNGKVVPGTEWKDGYKGWEFTDGASKAPSQTISYDFWSGYSDYAVQWNYDAASNTYLRSQGGEKHTDLNNEKQVAAHNVVVMLTTEKGPLDEKKHMMYEVIGTGDALIFKNGEAIKATWSKKDRESELVFTDKGKPVVFNRGLTWVSIVGKTTDVKY